MNKNIKKKLLVVAANIISIVLNRSAKAITNLYLKALRSPYEAQAIFSCRRNCFRHSLASFHSEISVKGQEIRSAGQKIRVKNGTAIGGWRGQY
ncbi:hypothetical protein SUGI_0475540 [Cryptomeria japonica]|nr:hypothetical protein SUGI_0475540 [Cryptomeria japonica]